LSIEELTKKYKHWPRPAQSAHAQPRQGRKAATVSVAMMCRGKPWPINVAQQAVIQEESFLYPERVSGSKMIPRNDSFKESE